MTNYCSLVITDTHIYESRLTKEGSTLDITLCKQHPRTSTIKQDVMQLLNSNKNANSTYGFLVVTPLNHTLKEYPTDVSFPEMVNAARDFVDTADESFDYDFLLQREDTATTMYIVGMPKDILKALGQATYESLHDNRLIDYWPNPLQNLNSNQSQTTITLIEEGDDIHGYIWKNRIILGHTSWHKNLEEPKEMVKRLCDYNTSDTVPKLMNYLSKETQTKWAAALQDFETVLPMLPGKLANTANIKLSNNPYMDAAIGMAYRLSKM